MSQDTPQIGDWFRKPKGPLPLKVCAIDGDHAWMKLGQEGEIVELPTLCLEWEWMDPSVIENSFIVTLGTDGKVSYKAAASLAPRKAVQLAAWLVYTVDPDCSMFNRFFTMIKQGRQVQS